MSTIFGGAVLTSLHFESQLAKDIFNDAKPCSLSPVRVAAERRVLAWIANAPPKAIMRFSRGVDRIVVPALSPAGFRHFCGFLCEVVPQAIENMPNTKESVTALARAMHLTKFANAGAMNRIANALAAEGFTS